MSNNLLLFKVEFPQILTLILSEDCVASSDGLSDFLNLTKFVGGTTGDLLYLNKIIVTKMSLEHDKKVNANIL